MTPGGIRLLHKGYITPPRGEANPQWTDTSPRWAHMFQLCYKPGGVIDFRAEAVLIYTHGGIPVGRGRIAPSCNHFGIPVRGLAKGTRTRERGYISGPLKRGVLFKGGVST